MSKDGRYWRYDGTAAIPAACTGPTLWAPELGYYYGRWHMWVTVVPGIYSTWAAKRFIVHLTSRNLKSWTCGNRLSLASEHVIDPAVAEMRPANTGFGIMRNHLARRFTPPTATIWSTGRRGRRWSTRPAKGRRRFSGMADGGW